MDLAALIVNFGILIVSGVAATVAWAQARAAISGAADADKARADAVTAQQTAATALAEANRIAAEARELLQGQDARSTERHDVRWKPRWDPDTQKWHLANRGQDTAHAVRIWADVPFLEPQTITQDDVPPNAGLRVALPTQMTERGEAVTVKWRVEWSTPLGTQRTASDWWPHS